MNKMRPFNDQAFILNNIQKRLQSPTIYSQTRTESFWKLPILKETEVALIKNLTVKKKNKNVKTIPLNSKRTIKLCKELNNSCLHPRFVNRNSKLLRYLSKANRNQRKRQLKNRKSLCNNILTMKKILKPFLKSSERDYLNSMKT